MKDELVINSPSFEDQGRIPMKHTGFGEDLSPAFEIKNLNEKGVSLVIIMDDLDIPFMKSYNHWVIWNIPRQESIPEGIPEGATVNSLNGAKQGIGYGRNRYAGPKMPRFIRTAHRYVFHIYALDTYLELSSQSRKKDVLKAMEGHVLQQGKITGEYQR